MASPLVQFTGKVLPDIKQQFEDAYAQSECTTFNQFFEMVMEAYLNPKTKPVEVPRPTDEQLAEIQLKDNEIGRLKIDLGFKQDAIERLESEKRDLSTQLEEIPQSLKLEANQRIITIPPIVGLVLDREAATAKKKGGKDFTHEDILLNSFWESITNGAAHPFHVWSNYELAQLKKQLQETGE
jgi:hypothetical protein